MHILIFPSKNLGKKCSYMAKIQSLFQIFQHLPLVIPVHSGTAPSACTPNWPALTRQLGSSLPEWVDTQEWYMSSDRTGRDTNWHLPSTSLNQLPLSGRWRRGHVVGIWESGDGSQLSIYGMAAVGRALGQTSWDAEASVALLRLSVLSV